MTGPAEGPSSYKSDYIGLDLNFLILRIIKRAIKRYGYKSALVSKLNMFKLNCITKEKFDKLYGITNGEKKNKTNNDRRDDLSVGEDLETYIRRIKNGEVTTETILENGEIKRSHLICLLQGKKRRKLNMGNKDFLKTFLHPDPDVPKEEWTKTEYKHLKFSSSFASRVTFFVEPEIEIPEMFEFFTWVSGPV